MTNQGTMGIWHRDARTGRREWRIESEWAQDDPSGWFVTRMANRSTRHDISDWSDWTEMRLETAAGECVEVIVDEAEAVWLTDGELAEDEVAEVARAFRVEVPR